MRNEGNTEKNHKLWNLVPVRGVEKKIAVERVELVKKNQKNRRKHEEIQEIE